MKNEPNKFTDTRDGKTYKIVTIGTQTWMEENLAFKPNSGNFWTFYNIESNIDIYGYLYDWETAKNVCPSGWHLPSFIEWTTLTDYVGINDGSKLKSTSGWNVSNNKMGTNENGFTALPGGYRKPSGQFKANGFYGVWWSSTEYDKENAWSRGLSFDIDSAGWEKYNLYGGFSVRCIKDMKSVNPKQNVDPNLLFKPKNENEQNQNSTNNSGPHFSLSGRYSISLPEPQKAYNVGGTIVVTIYVDRNGKVIKAIPGAKGSTTTDATLRKLAMDAAFKSTFDAKPNAAEEQMGTITYQFKLN